MDVCFVVNAVGPTSIPADVAVALNEFGDTNVGIVAWFGAEEFDGCAELPIYELETGRDSTVTSIDELSDILRDYDVVHVHHSHSGSIAKIVGKAQGNTIVATENSAHDRLSPPGYVANGMTNTLADAVVCVSETVRQSFGRWEALLARGRVETIYNGVNLQRLDETVSGDWELDDHVDLRAGCFVVGHVGALKPAKSQTTLMKGIATVESLVERDVELVVAGDGPLRDELATQATKLDIDSRVHFLGQLQRSEVYQMIDAVDAFAMPSRNEAFCVAVAEAMATGTPCVLSNIPVFREVYNDAALYHEVGDSEGFAKSIAHLVDNSPLREILGRRGDELVRERYSLDETAGRYHRLYKSLS